MTLRDKLLAFDDRQREPVEEWGQKFFVRAMSESEHQWYLEQQLKAKKAKLGVMPNMLATIVTMTACDDEWKSIFERTDAKALAEKSHAIVDRLAEKALALSGYSNASTTQKLGNLIAKLSISFSREEIEDMTLDELLANAASIKDDEASIPADVKKN